mmetsp:Transcript_18013/g.52205  ORF Transcript_18013/g.52205 Transcript_18013/m.52205 type:complete len:203 (-) Transcript_18013:420-1028(-)
MSSAKMIATAVVIVVTILLVMPVANGHLFGRRHFLASQAAAVVPPTAGIVLGATPAFAAAPNEAELLKDLTSARSVLADLPDLVGDQRWDPVRVRLRIPSVAALWNVNDSGNTLRRLARSLGDPEIIEASEDVAQNLRDVDQIVYSNVFSMEGKMAGAGLRTDGGAVGRAGEGGGKYRVEEPQELLRAALRSIDGVLSAAAE